MVNPKIQILIGRDFPNKVIPLIKKAKHSIYIIVYDWYWYPNEIGENIQIFNNAIINAHKKGILVKAIVKDHKIYEILKREYINVKRIKSSKTLHIKSMVLDNKILILGSHNYTKSAFNINYEASVIIRDEKIALQYQDIFSDFFS